MADEKANSTNPPLPKPRLAGIIWAMPKVGKTTYAVSSPGKKIIINLDPEGYVSVMEKVETGEVEVWDYSDYTAKDLIEHMTSDKIERRIRDSGMTENDTFLFDSVTMMNKHGLSLAIAKDIGAGKAFSPTLEAPGISAYGARTAYLTDGMWRILRATRRIGCHIWFLAHEDTPERNEKGEFLYQSILMSENSLNQASASISEIWWMRDIGNNGRELYVRPALMHKPMGSRMFRMDGKSGFKLSYDPEKPDMDQPHSIASLWAKFRSDGKKLMVPDK